MKNENIHIEIGQRIAEYLLTDNSTVEDVVLSNWLAESENNRVVFQEYQKIWKEIRNISDMQQFDADRAWEKINEVNRQKEMFRRRVKNVAYTLTGIAASVLIFLGLNFFYPSEPNKEMLVEVETEYGNRSDITLPDGSKIKLNAGSQLVYVFNSEKKIREVKFQGEGFFEVSKSDMPFQITLPGDLEVRVLGTTFNLSAYEDDASYSLSLIEGGVEMKSGKETLRLMSGQMAEYNKTNNQLNYVEGNLSYSYGWLKNKLYMEDMSLSEVCKHLERWFNVKITVEKSIGETIFYSGVLKEESINEVLDALEKLSKIKYSIKDNNIHIYAK